jgi:endoribonuclease Dicer
LPLPSKDLVYIGYPKRSKREARRSVAFLAVKHLLRLNVFNEYLLPVSHEGVEESDEDLAPRHVVDEKLPPEIMDVRVKDPWYLGEKLWLHKVLVAGKATAGMVTGTSLPPAVVLFRGREVHLCAGAPLPLDLGGVPCARQIMNEFTKWGIRARNTGRPFDKCTFFLVPLRKEGDIDFDKMIHHLQTPPSTDWSTITEDVYDRIFVLNRWESGRTYRLKVIRTDLGLESVPLEGSPASKFTKYSDYYKDKWTTKRREAIIPLEGPLLEVVPMTKQFDGAYSLNTPVPVGPGEEGEESKRCLVPRSTCSWVPFPLDLSDAFASLPVLCRRVTDIYRVQNARQDLRLPYVPDNLLIEALTLPMSLRGFNNQRLETLGDAVLNLSTTIQLLNQYPNRHEGQLSKLRQKYIANRYLLNRAREFGLVSYLSSEATPISLWRYANSTVEIVEGSGPPQRSVSVTYPRRSLQDCVEALMGATYLCGGIDMALRTGTALGLNFGGSIPWPLRYHSWRPEVPVAPLFTMLQEKMGYEFKWNHILVEAVTHPSFASSDGTSYQRLEFLGDCESPGLFPAIYTDTLSSTHRACCC